MDLIDEIKSLAARIEKSRDHVATEEAAKNAYVMPFIAALGYDVFDPTEVTPEMVCDVGVKKGEKIDYAIKKDDKVIMLFECKHHSANPANEHASQLYRYFSVTDARVGVLTNAEFLADNVGDKLRTALGAATDPVEFESRIAKESLHSSSKSESEVETTEEELEGCYTVRPSCARLSTRSGSRIVISSPILAFSWTITIASLFVACASMPNQ